MSASTDGPRRPDSPTNEAAGSSPKVGQSPRQLAEVSLSGIYEISKILARPQRLEATLASVLSVMSSFLDMKHATVMLLEDEHMSEILVGRAWAEAAEFTSDAPRLALDQIVATAMPLIVESIAESPLFFGTATESADTSFAFIGVPIKVATQVAGTVSIDRPRPTGSAPSFDHDVRFLSMVANLIGQTIQLHRVIAKDRERLMAESRRLEKELTIAQPSRARLNVAGIIGDSPPIRTLLEKIHVVAKSNATVLLRGESGTGKELFARAIHELSRRSKGPFVKVNCAALPESVLESELFGHEKGAFTGAVNTRKGRFELADGGTIFLDEIGEISASFQAKLLRVLQEGEIDRIGGTRTQKVDVRVVAATNRDLEDAVVKGTFRADLYYRIAVIPLQLPSLRDRKGDIPALAQTFLREFNKENDRDLKLTQGAIDVLKACYFPGNVRELQNCVCRTATLAKGSAIEANDFGCGNGECLSATLWMGRAASLSPTSPQGITLPARPMATRPSPHPTTSEQIAPPAAVKPCECGADFPGEGPCTSPDDCMPLGAGPLVPRERLVDAMERSGWVQAKAARILGLTPRQIGYALKRHNIPIKRF